ncbi:hypothetical protein MUO79_01360 [Candidatus Bathyarchaeota archaeon]|nr:hypothetical protein [Candidatus Bathyarchaeota archaeon]
MSIGLEVTTIIMPVVKTVLELLASCLIYSLVVALIDFVLIFFFRSLDQIASSLSFVMLVEGGVGLTVGGVVAFFSPLSGKIEEVIFHSDPWNANRQKEAEKQARTWIVTGLLLVLVSFLVSAL